MTWTLLSAYVAAASVATTIVFAVVYCLRLMLPDYGALSVLSCALTIMDVASQQTA